MFSTFDSKNVTLLLKDITGMVEPQPASVREKLIQGGVHYCEMLPLEYSPSESYLKTYENALRLYAGITAEAVAVVAERILKLKGAQVVLVSLARAGTPIGILIKRYIRMKYCMDVPHYTISIIRGRGIDHNAMRTILSKHRPTDIQFVDGWTGKGAIQKQLRASMSDYPDVDSSLAVLSDPAYIAGICGTHEDFLIASSCLNSTVSGLISRTFLRSDIIGEQDYHGAAFYSNLMAEDRTEEFLSAIEAKFPSEVQAEIETTEKHDAFAEVERIQHDFGIHDINLVKPSIGEATRVLLRRMPWKILVHSLNDENHLGHLYQLAKEKEVQLIEYPMRYYKACGLIRELADT